MRFAEFINEVVSKRKLPLSAEVITPRVVIKVRRQLFQIIFSSLSVACRLISRGLN